MTVLETVAAKIAEAGPNVVDIVSTKLAQVEIDKRVEMIITTLGRLDTLKKDLRKIDRADTITFVNDVKNESWSAARYEQVKKAKEVITKIELLLNTALETNTSENYQKLSDGLKNSQSKDSGEVKSES